MYSRFVRRFVLPVAALLSFYLTFVSSFPISSSPPPKVPLRILPLGDSITWGTTNTTPDSSSNGYRLGLSKLLSDVDWEWTFVGTQHSGNMTNNANEGHPGFTIQHIADVCDGGLAMKPNVVLLHAGTNDMNYAPPPQGEDYEGAPKRLAKLIEKVNGALPDAVILVARILSAANNEGTAARVKNFNTFVPGVVDGFALPPKNKTVYMVDMEKIPTYKLYDGVHPTPLGYYHMGVKWFEDLVKVEERIKPPPKTN